jgi:hypothetical protein
MLTLLYYSSLVIYGMVVVQSSVIFTGIGAEVTEQVEFGVFKSLVINQRKNKVLYKL